MLGKDPATLTKAERNIAKMVNFGIIYGISAFGLSEDLEIPREEAQEYIDAYLARFPHVQAFIERTIAHAAADGYATSSWADGGRCRSCARRTPTRVARRALRGQLRHAGLERGHHQGGDDPDPRAAPRGGPRARLVLQVHDELLLEVPETEVSAVRELVREEMCGAYPLDPPLASTSASATTGTSEVVSGARQRACPVPGAAFHCRTAQRTAVEGRRCVTNLTGEVGERSLLHWRGRAHGDAGADRLAFQPYQASTRLGRRLGDCRRRHRRTGRSTSP